jgi:hypothetical protein
MAQSDPILQEIKSLDAELIPILVETDSAWRLAELLPTKYPPEIVARPPGDRAWELAGFYLLRAGRAHEALGLFWALYVQMLQAQEKSGRIHKGMPLIWMSDCFFGRLGFPVHAKRYLMLTLCEDAQREKGIIRPEITGVYFRLVWLHGLPHDDLARYGKALYELSQKIPAEALFPEALLQRMDGTWLTEMPSSIETLYYRTSPFYVNHLLNRLGDGTGEALEFLSQYLMSCMPGCRAQRRRPTHSSDLDIVCAMDGLELDFRSEFGHYFVCECKDWEAPADFATMAKFCRVLDSIKARFGILFSRSGISGTGTAQFAEREQLKVYQDRGVVIVVLGLSDLQAVARGANLITLLRRQYETVRLDLRSKET